MIKTQAMNIGSRQHLRKDIEKQMNSPLFVIDDCPKELVDSTKYLGFQVDKQRVWDE